MKTPPDRSGITFRVGAQVEARDRLKNWYPATIKKVDSDKERVLIHYRQWSRRHDEWFHWNSQYLRPLERVSLRRRSLNPSQMFVTGTKVLACWTDCRFYPAKILRVNRDDSYTVRFYDGVVRTVKPTKIKPFQRKSKSEKCAVGSEGWEEGESEEEPEEDGGRKDEDEKTGEGKGEQETGGADEEEEKRKGGASAFPPPAKKKTVEGRSSGEQSLPVAGDPAHSLCLNPASINRDVLLERQAHLPTTHKFSREPLYRVIKNQPPPILSIELDHNRFKCPSAGCSKSFRKASLLHYHIKYYHTEQQLDPAGAEHEPPRRKRASSEGGESTAAEKKREIQNLIRHHDDAALGSMGTEMKKEGGRERSGERCRKERKNFLRIKFKKKKKKKKKKKSQTGLDSSDDENSDRLPIPLTLPGGDTNPHTAVEEGSDWSTLTAESGEDTPSWPVAMETEECEVVRCVCEVDEENDFMIQCESCLCWQHGTCMGLYEHNVPCNYICYYCRHTTGWRRAQRLPPEPDWLITGRMFGLSCVKENYSEINASKMALTGRLLAHTHILHQVLSGLQLKVSLLHSPSPPDLQLWRLPWRQEEEGLLLASSPKEDPASCYVSSEHCYQKPGASWEAADEGDEDGPELGHKEIKTEDPDSMADNNKHTVAQRDTLCKVGIKTEKHLGRKEHAHTWTHMPEARQGSEVECQLNLLEHVESLHHQITARMDLIERELEVLESWLDHSGELEPPDPLSRLPQLKQRIRLLLRDLCTVRHLSLCS